jgi:hypothetical protein
LDQTGFVHGRSISAKFVYAADLLSCCYKRKVPTAVLKLDFKKAFDSVEWASLDAILAARGFDDRWRSWVSNILNTGKTAVFQVVGLAAAVACGRAIPFRPTCLLLWLMFSDASSKKHRETA